MKKKNTFALIAVLSMTLASCEKSDRAELPQLQSRIQQIVEEEMAAPVANREPDWACAILLDKEGKVVALYDTDPSNAHINQRMQLGNLMEPFTILSALLTQRVDAVSSFAIIKSGINTGTHCCKDSHLIDSTLYVQDIIAISSRVGTYRIMEQAFVADAQSPQYFNAFMHQLGIESNIETISELLRQSYLNEFDVTPLQLARLYHRLAQGSFPQEWDEAISIILDGMHDVVWNNKLGTASRSVWSNGAQSDNVQIMGKTGTVQIKHDPYHHIISFCGSFPEEAPEYTCLVIVANPHFPYSAKMDCAVPVRKIAERIYDKQ